jgi:LCP family protein required for cell wall assembly
MSDNEKNPWYDRPPRPTKSDRTQAPTGHEYGRPSRPSHGGREQAFRPRATVPFQDANAPFANELPAHDPPKASRSGGLFKSPFPVPSAVSASGPFQERLADADDLTRAGRPDSFSPPPYRGDDTPDILDDRGGRRSSSRSPADLDAGEEAMDEMLAPPRRRAVYEEPLQHFDGDDGQPPIKRRRRRKGADFAPPGQMAVPGGGRKSHRLRSTILKTMLATVLLIGCSGISFAFAYFYQLYTFAQSVTGKTLPNTGTTKKNIQPTALPDNLAGVDAFNLLLLGSDNDAKFSSGAVLTQTDIVVRVDLKNHKITMVSIPRDFWIPNDYGTCCYKLDQISGNETYGSGDPKLNGFAHTEATIENDFGIPISGFAWVGLQGFVNVINTLGGVDVDVLHPIVDDAYPKDINNGNPYDYQRLYIPAGPQHLDGETALDYVRSRHSDLTGDFGRSARQQSVLVALKKKLEDPTIFTKLPEFADDLKNDVLTSLTIPQILSLANFARGLKPTDFVQVVLSAPEYASNGTVNGQSVVQPNWTKIGDEIKQLFPDAAPPQVNLHNFTASDIQKVKTEGARIQIENGATNAPGVAAKLQTFLTSQGFNVVQVKNASTHQLTSSIQELSSNGTKFDGTVQVLHQMLDVLPQNAVNGLPSGIDIDIIIGDDTAQQILNQLS